MASAGRLYLAGLVPVLLVCLCSRGAETSRILFVTIDHHSHVNFFAVCARALQDAGHEVRVLAMDRHKKAIERQNIKGIYMSSTRPSVLASGDWDKLLFEKGGTDMKEIGFRFAADFVESCEEMLQNEALLNEIEAFNADLMLVDGFDLGRCVYIFPHKFHVPYITLTARHDPWNAGIPAMPSTESLQGFGASNLQTVYARLKNLLGYVLVLYLMPPPVVSDDLIVKYAPERQTTTFQQLFRNSEMWLVNMETICLDSPRVYARHYQFIAGMGLESSKPLSEDLEKFVSESPAGVIVASFGSAIKKIPLDMLRKMVDAFGQVDLRVIMRHDGEIPDHLPDNVKLMPWVPQNDLLGHVKTRLFITHGGNNGQLEALFHGVPMLTLPVFGDQFYNAKRVEKRGFGLTVEAMTLSTQALVAAIRELTANPMYHNNIRACAEQFQSFPKPQETLIFWVEHVIRFGGDNLKPDYMDMPLWKLFMLDVLLVILVALFVVVAVLFCSCRWLCSRLRRRLSGPNNIPTKAKAKSPSPDGHKLKKY